MLSPDSLAFFLSISQKELHPYTYPDPHSKLRAVLYWASVSGSCDKTEPIGKWSAVDPKSTSRGAVEKTKLNRKLSTPLGM